VKGFDEKKITSGMDGFLRQEFRELEILDQITRLRFEGTLPRSVTGIYRGQLIASYRAYKGKSNGEPDHFHEAIKFDPKKDSKKIVTDYGQWHPTNKVPPKIKATASTNGTSNKRKAASEKVDASNKKQKPNPPTNQGTLTTAPTNSREPRGLVWDSTNYSCAYDALFTPLGEIFQDNPTIWREKLAACSAWLGLWAINLDQNPNAPETARDAVRRLLHFQNPTAFPIGPINIKLDSLLMAMTDRRSYGTSISQCERCGYQKPGTIETLSQYIDVSLPRSIAHAYPLGMHVQEWFDYHFDRPFGRCPDCNSADSPSFLRRKTTITELPTFLLLSISTPDILLDWKLAFKMQDHTKSLQLRGLIYHSVEGLHFTSVVIDKTGLMWYHDGITTKRACKKITSIKDIADLKALHRINQESLAAAVYAEEHE
jgi:hypothetical protein